MSQESINNQEDKKQKSSDILTSEGAQESLLLADTDGEQDTNKEDVLFSDLGLNKKVLKAITDLGYENPTPIQVQAIPVVMQGHDMIGQAQTGTGKTAAFALPILSNFKKGKLYALVLEPTRELAIQSAESFQNFAKYIDGFHVAPIYGGASYDSQIRTLRHGASVVVATPGRLIDLIEKGKVDLSEVEYMVIDEADEMLRMGFIDDVDWILSHTPDDRKTALFSATMPPAIKNIATNHLKNPVEVKIQSKTTTATTVRQRYWVVSGVHKVDAMSRMLEVEDYDAVIVFVRTKTDAEDVANKLMARGLACAALHGDIPQRQREKIIERLKKSSLDIIIATDVAARGLDVDRVTHVFNYDIPYDAESYVHRIGRTGRAGRTGEAILFVSPRERRALRQIERITRQKIEPMAMPTVEDVNKSRLNNFKNQILQTIQSDDLQIYEDVISSILEDTLIDVETLCAALAKMAQKDGQLLLSKDEIDVKMKSFDDEGMRSHSKNISAQAVPLKNHPEINMVRYKVAVGRKDGVKPGQIVGAIANEGNLDSEFIGEICIYDCFSTVDLPEDMPAKTHEILSRARVCGRALNIKKFLAKDNKHKKHDYKDFDGEDNLNDRSDRKDKSRSSRPKFLSFDGKKDKSKKGFDKDKKSKKSKRK